jgi:hypothetical protein
LQPAPSMSRLILVTVLVSTLAACGGGSKSPSSPTDAPRLLQGHVVNAVSGAPTGNLTVSVAALRSVTTDSDGNFSIDVNGAGAYTASIRGGSIVERETTLVPTTERPRLSVIPTVFDLTAFDEMFRSLNSRLQRWTSRPALVVVATTMEFHSTSDDVFEASSEQMTDDEVSQMVAHVSEGLALLTGDTYTSFASVDVERPKPGDRVSTSRTGKIVVGRYTGIVTFANTIGYGRWLETSSGTIVGGAMYLDRDFDRGDGRRRLLRIHELGHALGYQHVRSRTSIMNPAVGPEPTDFDRAGAIIAFQRPPGNRPPDVDPAGGALSSTSEGSGRWSPPSVCEIHR